VVSSVPLQGAAAEQNDGSFEDELGKAGFVVVETAVGEQM
jgi:hypothetical protein